MDVKSVLFLFNLVYRIIVAVYFNWDCFLSCNTRPHEHCAFGNDDDDDDDDDYDDNDNDEDDTVDDNDVIGWWWW